MCYTLAGRLQTRALTLSGPLGLAWLLASLSDKPDYWTLFSLMLVLGFVLDMAVYSWLITYQPRWLTLLLAVIEFGLLKWIVEWPYPFELRLRTRQALIFYLLAWLLIWLTLQALLPRYRPRWAEDNGELLRRWRPRPAVSLSVQQRRRAYGRMLIGLSLALLPWATALIRTPRGFVMTGLLLHEQAHLTALAQSTSVLRGGVLDSLAGAVGWLALHGRWPVLPLYYSAWIVGAALTLLGMHVAWPDISGGAVLLISALLVWLSLPWLLLSAITIWTLALVPRPLTTWRLPQRRTSHMALGAALIWSIAWLRLFNAPLLYLDQGTWQAVTWLQQSAPHDAAIAAPRRLQPLIAGLTGHIPVNEGAPVGLHLTTGSGCDDLDVRFRHGPVCIIGAAQRAEMSR